MINPLLVEVTDQAPVPTIGVFARRLYVVKQICWSLPAFEVVGVAFAVTVNVCVTLKLLDCPSFTITVIIAEPFVFVTGVYFKVPVEDGEV